MLQKRPAYLTTRVLKRFVVYLSFVGFGLGFWWLSENSINGLQGHPRFLVNDSERGEMVRALQERHPKFFGEKLLERSVDRVLKGESLSGALSRNGFSPQETLIASNLLRKEINLRLIQPGDVVIIERKPPSVQAQADTNTGDPQRSFFEAFELIKAGASGLPVRFRIERKTGLDSGKSLFEESDYALSRVETEVSYDQEMLSGIIETSLYDAILKAGGDPSLVNRFSELFGWQVDFYRETQPGDTFRLIVETKYADRRFVGYGPIKAAQYTNSATSYRGFYYTSADGEQSGFFDEKGTSLEKSFFKSPMQLTRITSRYGQRFHPVLGRLKKHNGIDYGAPTGTPFWAVADGTVIEARYSPSAGNMVRIKHQNGFVTEYFHASRIARGIRAGAQVKQKQVIGYVGTTGRSTGPHLHFGMIHNKNYVNPSNQKLAIEIVLPKKERARFQEAISPLLTQLVQTKSDQT